MESVTVVFVKMFAMTVIKRSDYGLNLKLEFFTRKLSNILRV